LLRLDNHACPEGLDARIDLRGWLQSFGLEQYEAAFREHAIDETVLPNLTAKDLKDLGVRIVGHRRRLLAPDGLLSGSERDTNR
jgi:SAM domain (Sterile alpha motif)